MPNTLEWELSDVLDALEANGAHHISSLDAPTGEEDFTLVDTLGSEDERLETVDELVSIAHAMQSLPKRQREVLRLRFESDLTQSEIAERMGVSQMQISRMLRAILVQLQDLTVGTNGS